MEPGTAEYRNLSAEQRDLADRYRVSWRLVDAVEAYHQVDRDYTWLRDRVSELEGYFQQQELGLATASDIDIAIDKTLARVVERYEEVVPTAEVPSDMFVRLHNSDQPYCAPTTIDNFWQFQVNNGALASVPAMPAEITRRILDGVPERLVARALGGDWQRFASLAELVAHVREFGGAVAGAMVFRHAGPIGGHMFHVEADAAGNVTVREWVDNEEIVLSTRAEVDAWVEEREGRPDDDGPTESNLLSVHGIVADAEGNVVIPYVEGSGRLATGDDIPQTLLGQLPMRRGPPMRERLLQAADRLPAAVWQSLVRVSGSALPELGPQLQLLRRRALADYRTRIAELTDEQAQQLMRRVERIDAQEQLLYSAFADQENDRKQQAEFRKRQSQLAGLEVLAGTLNKAETGGQPAELGSAAVAFEAHELNTMALLPPKTLPEGLRYLELDTRAELDRLADALDRVDPEFDIDPVTLNNSELKRLYRLRGQLPGPAVDSVIDLAEKYLAAGHRAEGIAALHREYRAAHARLRFDREIIARHQRFLILLYQGERLQFVDNLADLDVQVRVLGYRSRFTPHPNQREQAYTWEQLSGSVKHARRQQLRIDRIERSAARFAELAAEYERLQSPGVRADQARLARQLARIEKELTDGLRLVPADLVRQRLTAGLELGSTDLTRPAASPARARP